MFKRLIRSLGRTPNVGVREPTFGEILLTNLFEAARGRINEVISKQVLSHIVQILVSLEIQNADILNEEDREKFGRAFLDLLLDNERLPPKLQLSKEEFHHPRDLLAGFFLGTVDVQSEAQVVLHFIERKFEDGRFAEAEVLLRIFDTDPANQRSNERNLFYEKMILRFTSNRGRMLSSARLDSWRRVGADALTRSTEGLVVLTRWLAQESEIRLHLQARNPIELSHWEEALSELDHTDRLAIISQLPPSRWRELSEHANDSVIEAAMRHISELTFEAHVDELIRGVYFVILATGRTGHENLILRVLRWLEKNFDGDTYRVLPDLHRMSTVEGRGIGEALEIVRASYLTGAKIGQYSKEEISEAILLVQNDLIELDIDKVPRGDYDLGALIYDKLIQFDYGSIEDAFRLHRLT